MPQLELLPDHLVRIIADPARLANLGLEQLLEALVRLERMKAELWVCLLSGPQAAQAKDQAAAAIADQLLTVPDVASETQFTDAYVYVAVRRQELAAVRKGKYFRIRRGDLQAWLEGRKPRGLDASLGARDSAPDGPRRTGRG